MKKPGFLNLDAGEGIVKETGFLSSDCQYQEITDWFIQHMERFKKFKENTPELEW